MAKPTEDAQVQFKHAHALVRNSLLAAGNEGDQFSEQLAKSLT